MPIQEQNIVFVKSQVMDDVPEGGGAATGTVIPDGTMNNVFEDISDLDRAMGRFNLRKIFLAVRTLSTDLYGGAKTVVTELPTDPALAYTLFTTNDPFDTRADAVARVEAYLYKGPMWPGALNENHIVGMRAISLIQNVNTELPPIGKTLCLVEDEGLSSEKEQYVRVIAVEAVETTFEDDKGTYTRWIIRCDLSDALRFDFDGHTVNRYNSYVYTGKTRVRDTTVADATRYFGSQKVVEDAFIGDLTIKAASIYTQLVPSAQTETPLVNQTLNGALAALVASRATPLTNNVGPLVIAPNKKLVLPTGVMPNSVSCPIGTGLFSDDGQGNALYGGTVVGNWNYATGECQLYGNSPTESGNGAVTYIPAAPAAQQAHTRTNTVTAENRRLNWIETLSPIPAPGVLTIAYMTLGNWYVLSDDGTGAISGSDPTYGAGTISFVTGDAAITLGALPDVGSQILWVWASGVHYAIRAGDTAIQPPVIPFSLGETVAPGSASINWLSGGLTKTATVAASGVISGDGTGRLVHGTGEVALTPTAIPDPNSLITIDYDQLTGVTESITASVDGAGQGTFSLGTTPIEPGSVSLAFTYAYYEGFSTHSRQVTVKDDAAGNLTGDVSGVTGTINYSNGAVTLQMTVSYTRANWLAAGGTWALATESTFLLANTVTATYAEDSATPSTMQQQVAMPPLTFDLTPQVVDAVVPGGLIFRYGGKTYVDRNGIIYRDINPNTGAGTIAGSINYETGVVLLTDWIVSGSQAVTVDALLTRYGEFDVIDTSFRTGISPIKSESLAINATTTDGLAITGTADPDGVIAGTWMRGQFNYEFGTGWVEFGQLSGPDWIPREVNPGTIRYNAVAYSYIPLDATILGIDAVRLPTDGRVPIYRAGDVVQIIHADTTTGTPAYNAGTDTYDLACGRTRIAWVRITDDNGDPVTDGYTLDRASGVVSWASIGTLATPVTIKHTVGDLRLVTDAQINGELTLARALSHDFPADESLVCACLVHGDRRARVSATWDQSSWDNTWKDYLVGSAATATLNLIDFPITVTNEGCDTDRWVLRWTSTTSVELISEKRGLVWSGSYPAYVSGTPVDIAPINPRTKDEAGLNGTPYLTIPQKANGGGWSAGNIARINTVGAIADFWIARPILQSEEPVGDGADGCEIYALGNIDRP